MDVRAQLSMIFNLDKCIGCHTCSVACKNVWTNRKGAEYMWWNNVETKPGTGYPSRWESQEQFGGGWEVRGDSLKLKLGGKLKILSRIFYNPDLPTMNQYYEPFTYDYGSLVNAPASDDQPVARPVSLITGRTMDKIEGGPNWDDDLSGTNDYAINDLNLTSEDKEFILNFQTMFMMYLPRICNHCLNPACVAACPSGAVYKRGEDGAVLVDQNRCRAWRMCVSACPYKKIYYNWNTGKSEKCIFCYPRNETGLPSACGHSCVGRIRYVGVLLYDADRLAEILTCEENELVEKFRDIILDPFDEKVITGGVKNGIPDNWITAAKDSPAYKFVKDFKIALPLHPEFRTFPMMFYVPPLSPVILAYIKDKYDEGSKGFIPSIKEMRIPVKYLSKLFSGGNESVIEEVLKKLTGIRRHMRDKNIGAGPSSAGIESGLRSEKLEEAYRLISLGDYNKRFVIPAIKGEEKTDAYLNQGEDGFGYLNKPVRGF